MHSNSRMKRVITMVCIIGMTLSGLGALLFYQHETKTITNEFQKIGKFSLFLKTCP